MSANEELSPEERLLKVIQQGKAPAAEAPKAPAAAVAPAKPAQEKAPAPRPAEVPRKTPAPPASTPAPAPAPVAATPKPAETPAPKLKLAEQPAPKPAPAAAPAAAAAEKPGAKIGAPTAESETAVTAAAVESVPETPVVAAMAPRGITISTVNRGLFALVVVVLAVAVADFLTGKTGAAVPSRADTDKAAAVAAAHPAKPAQPLAPMEKFLNRRNPFADISKPVEGTTSVVTNKLQNADFKLMAISLERSEAESMAILAGKDGKQTYYVKSGQTVGDTDVTLKQVLADHVILKNKKGEWELR